MQYHRILSVALSRTFNGEGLRVVTDSFQWYGSASGYRELSMVRDYECSQAAFNAEGLRVVTDNFQC